MALASDDEETLDLLVQAAVRVAFGEVPDDVMQILRTGHLEALEKGVDEVRPIMMGSSLRRLALKGLCRARKKNVAEAAGENQYGVGRKGGANLMVKCLQAIAESKPTKAFIKVDIKSAFNPGGIGFQPTRALVV